MQGGESKIGKYNFKIMFLKQKSSISLSLFKTTELMYKFLLDILTEFKHYKNTWKRTIVLEGLCPILVPISKL